MFSIVYVSSEVSETSFPFTVTFLIIAPALGLNANACDEPDGTTKVPDRLTHPIPSKIAVMVKPIADTTKLYETEKPPSPVTIIG